MSDPFYVIEVTRAGADDDVLLEGLISDTHCLLCKRPFARTPFGVTCDPCEVGCAIPTPMIARTANEYHAAARIINIDLTMRTRWHPAIAGDPPRLYGGSRW